MTLWPLFSRGVTERLGYASSAGDGGRDAADRSRQRSASGAPLAPRHGNAAGRYDARDLGGEYPAHWSPAQRGAHQAHRGPYEQHAPAGNDDDGTRPQRSGADEHRESVGVRAEWVFRPLLPQPAAATGIWAVSSSSASDTAGPTVSIAAIRTGGFLHQPSAQALTGTSRVQIGTQTDYIEIDKFTLSAACVGDVSLYDAVTVGNLLAVIPKGQTNARYLGIHWFPVPATALTYYVDYTRTTPDLTATDEPLLPQETSTIS